MQYTKKINTSLIKSKSAFGFRIILFFSSLLLITTLTSCSLLSNLRTPDDEIVVEDHIQVTDEIKASLQFDPFEKERRNSSNFIKSIDRSLKYLSKQEPDNSVKMLSETKIHEIIATLEDLKQKSESLGDGHELISYIRDNYKFYRYGTGKALITGYYEAQLNGSTKRTSRFRYPLYKHPKDILKVDLKKFHQFEGKDDAPKELIGREYVKGRVGPYYTRKEIESGRSLARKKEELVWVDDPIGLFFLQIQGSGIITLTDGRKMHVNFAGSNGHLYRSIGEFLVKHGKMKKKEVTAQAIKRYLREHPNEAQQVYEYNPSYSFFREVEEGPLGCIGVPVTAYRSIATDPQYYPKGAPALLITKIPDVDENGEVRGQRDFVQIVMNQDTGGAIKGPKRVDLFTGKGEVNENIAGALKEDGELYFFVKK